MSALSTQSASPSSCDTATSPLRMCRYQCSVRSPSAMSKRTVPVMLCEHRLMLLGESS